MRVINWVVTALAGIAVAALLAPLAADWPAAAIGAGAVVTGGLLLVRRGGRKHYALSGIAYTLGLATLIAVTGLFPPAYEPTAVVGLVLWGLLGAFLVALKVALGRIVRRVAARYGDQEYVQAVYDAVASVAGLVAIAWTIATIHERAARYGGIGLGAAGTLTANYVGLELPVAAWFLGEGIDVVLVLFVGCTLGLFHVLESLHTTWIATKQTAATGVEKGRDARTRLAEGGDAAGDAGGGGTDDA